MFGNNQSQFNQQPGKVGRGGTGVHALYRARGLGAGAGAGPAAGRAPAAPDGVPHAALSIGQERHLRKVCAHMRKSPSRWWRGLVLVARTRFELVTKGL